MPTFRTPTDLTGQELRNAVVQVLSSPPSSPTDGRIYYDNVIPGLRIRQAGAWVTLGVGPSSATTGALGVVQLAGDLGGSGTTAAAPLIGSVSELVNGSVGTPAVRFAASQSTGLYSSATNQVDLAANGVQTFHSTSTATTLPLPVTLTQGGTITAGGLTVSAGGITVTLGGLTVSAGTTSTQALTSNGMHTASGGLTIGASQTFDAGSNRLLNVGTPTSASDAVNKSYADALILGISTKLSAVVETTGAETFTVAAGSVTQIAGTTVNGVTPNVNDRVLVKDAPAASGVGSANSTQPGNGLYVVTNNTTNLTLARDTEMSGSNAPLGTFVFSDKTSAGYIVSTPSTSGAFTYGTNNIAFTQFSGAGEITAGTGLTKSGNTLSLSTPVSAANGGLGAASLTAHGVIVAQGASAATSLVGSTSGLPLLAQGASSDPTFAALSLSGAGVTGTLPLASGGTNATSAAAARGTLAVAAVDAHTITGDSSTASFTWTPAAAPKVTGGWAVTLINTTTGNTEYADVSVNQTTNAITVAFGVAPATGTNYTAVCVG